MIADELEELDEGRRDFQEHKVLDHRARISASFQSRNRQRTTPAQKRSNGRGSTPPHIGASMFWI
jgi:hypothetical protein